MRFKIEFTAKGRRLLKAPKPEAPVQAFTSPAARQLALAYWIDRRIESGELRDLADAARLIGVSRARMTQIANLLLLPLDVQEQVLAPGFRGSERALRPVVATQQHAASDMPVQRGMEGAHCTRTLRPAARIRRASAEHVHDDIGQIEGEAGQPEQAKCAGSFLRAGLSCPSHDSGSDQDRGAAHPDDIGTPSAESDVTPEAVGDAASRPDSRECRHKRESQ